VKNKKIILLLLALSLKLASVVQAQDLHFSQFFNSPLLTNPANTGFIPDADYRIGALYRNQYSSILASPYKTVSLFGDAQVLRDRFDNGWVGLGGLILNDAAGSGGLVSNKVYASMAYHQMLGLSSLLSAGFNLGWVNKRIDQSKLNFPDQFDGKFFDANAPTTVQLATTNINYFDMQVGLNYAYFPTENVYINGGYSLLHVNQPKETFFSSNYDSSRISMRHSGFVNAILKVNDRVIINPNAYYSNQARASEAVIGINANYNLSGEGGDMQLLAGVYYRVGDAIIPMLGFEIKKIIFTFSYDATTSSLSNFDQSNGASEFSIIKKGFYTKSGGDTRQVLCPKF
jgi:type IX secretion system PorP/SprF family membrane protein